MKDIYLTRCCHAWNSRVTWEGYIWGSCSRLQEILGDSLTFQALSSHWKSEIHPKWLGLHNGAINQHKRSGSLINCPTSSQLKEIQSSVTKKLKKVLKHNWDWPDCFYLAPSKRNKMTRQSKAFRVVATVGHQIIHRAPSEYTTPDLLFWKFGLAKFVSDQEMGISKKFLKGCVVCIIVILI